MANGEGPVAETKVRGSIPRMEPISEPPKAEARSFPACPRCGGDGKPPKRRTKNPFLEEHVTCVDCGMEFEPTNVWPW